MARRGTHIEILTWLDDHSRYALSVTAHHRVTGPIVVDTFRKAHAAHGIPVSTLTDNGMVFTTRFAGGKGGRNHLETELAAYDVEQINSTPNHPTTCGKVERFQQTLKKWLTRQPAATTIAELQTNSTPSPTNTTTADHTARCPTAPLPPPPTRPAPKPHQATRADTHDRVRTDRVDQAGSITLRLNGRLHHIGVGRIHYRTRVLILVQDLNISVINSATGELLRDSPSTPPGTTNPPEPPRAPHGKNHGPKEGPRLFRCPATSQVPG